MALHFGKRDNEPTTPLNQGLNSPLTAPAA
jgi:hypothetical protein